MDGLVAAIDATEMLMNTTPIKQMFELLNRHRIEMKGRVKLERTHAFFSAKVITEGKKKEEAKKLSQMMCKNSL